MGQITGIETQKKRKDRFNIFLDGDFAFGLSGEAVFLNKLKTGKDLTQTEVNKLIQADQVERLFEKGIRFLGFRPRSEKEVRGYLTFKGKLKDLETEEEKHQYTASINQAIERLKKLGYLNDIEFAQWWLDQREKFRPRGTRLLKLELIQKGLDREIIDEAIEGVRTTVDSEVDQAFKVADKKIKNYKKLEPRELKIKMGQYLARQGFDWSVVKKVVDTISKNR